MIPALVQWEITNRCPYRCGYCYHDGLKRGKARLDLEEEEMWRIAEIIVKNRLFFVTFTGGEPLIRKDLLVKLVRFIRQSGGCEHGRVEPGPINRFCHSG